MAVTLRLARHGQKKRPFYRIVATDSRSRRDGRFIEIIGSYDTLSNPQKIVLKEDRVRYWLGTGAQTTQVVNRIIKKIVPGYLEDLEKSRRAKIQSVRKARKERLKSGSSKTPIVAKTKKRPVANKTTAKK